MTVQAPACVEAEVMHKAMTTGRNKAVLLGCRAADGSVVDCVLKFPDCLNGMAPLPYLVEWFAAALGELLAINVATPLEVLITPDFARGLESPWRERAAKSIGSAFGSLFCPGLTQWTPNALVPMDLRVAAVELLAFDIFIHNPDRRIDNPNVLVSRQTFFAFDNEDAFSFLLPILGRTEEPATEPLYDILQNHVFARGLGNKIPSLDRFRAAVIALTDGQFEEIGAAAPVGWKTGMASGKSATIIEVMRRRRDAIERWLPRMEAWIQR